MTPITPDINPAPKGKNHGEAAMSKRKIEAALKSKGLTCEVIEYGHHATPGEMVGGWDIELDEESTVAVLMADVHLDFDDLQPDCRNTDDVLEWIGSLPNLKAFQ